MIETQHSILLLQNIIPKNVIQIYLNNNSLSNDNNDNDNNIVDNDNDNNIVDNDNDNNIVEIDAPITANPYNNKKDKMKKKKTHL
ncbi:unnamed protein product, partial [Rotaria socialis]